MTPATEQLPSLCPLDASGGAEAVAGVDSGRSEIAVENFLCDDAGCCRPSAQLWLPTQDLAASCTVALDCAQRR
eukprot:m.198950 g.198950  ORF g.198950 m.198950 type:complete len:74 (+) comp18768_c1_seq3:1585-1806(+)